MKLRNDMETKIMKKIEQCWIQTGKGDMMEKIRKKKPEGIEMKSPPNTLGNLRTISGKTTTKQ